MNIIAKRSWFFVIAGVMALACIIALATLGIQTGIEFSAGSILNISFDQPVDQNALKIEISAQGYPDALIQTAGSEGKGFIIRTSQLSEEAGNQLENALVAKFGTLKVNEFDNVSALIASETARNAAIAVAVAALAMLLYIAWAFHRMPNPFRYGVCAIAGLVFDLLVALGVFSILGAIRGWQIDLMFVAGILAILGYSINNTVVVFDRIRENTARGISGDIEIVANSSIVQTLGRSLNASITTLITLLVLALFVGASIQNFVIVLMIGVITGIFTSTCLSPEILVAWHKRNELKGNARLVEVKAKS
jgi:preprotein translocase subunit SecF